MSDVSVRRVENVTTDGPGQERTEVSYVIGAEIDGQFVPFFTRTAGYVEHHVQRGQAAAERGQAAQGQSQGQADQGGTGSASAGKVQPTTTTQGGSEGGGS